MLPLLLAIFSAILGAVNNLLARRLLGFTKTRDLVAFNFVLMGVMLLPGLPFFWHFEPSANYIFRVGIAIGLDALGNYGYFKAFEVLDVVTASSALAVSPLVTLLISPFFFSSGGYVNGFQVLGVGITSLGLYLLAGGPVGSVRPNWNRWKQLAWPLMAALAFSLSIFVMKTPLEIGAINPYSYYFVRSVGIAAVLSAVTRPNLAWIKKERLAFTAGRLVFVIAQWLLLLDAVALGNPVIVKSIGDTAPFFVGLFAWIGLGEKISARKTLGMVAVLLGIGLISG